MEKIILSVILYIIFIMPVQAQQVNAPADEATSADSVKSEDTKSVSASGDFTVDGQKKGPGTAEFTIGAIVIKGEAVASVERAATVTEVSSADIEARSDKLLADVLNMVPSIQIARHRKGNEQFYMRGYDMSKVALLVDGIPVTDAYGGNMDIDNIGVMNISRIVINKGVSSALYGTKGTVGSINIITARPEEMYTELDAEYGQYQNYNINVSHGAPLGNFYYWISGVYDKSEGYEISKKLNREKRELWVWKFSRYDHYGFYLNDLYGANRALRAYLDEDGKWKYTEHEKYKITGKTGYNFTPDIEAGVSSFYNYTEKKNSTYSSSMTYTYDYNQSTGAMTWNEPVASGALGNMSTHWPEYYNYSVAPYISYKKDDFRLKGNIYFYEQSNTLEAFKDPYEYARSWNQTDETATWSIWTSQSYGLNLYPSYKFSSWNRLNSAVSFTANNHKQEEKAQDGATQVIENYGTGAYETQYIEGYYLTLAIEDEIKISGVEFTAGISYDAQKLAEFRKKENIDGSTKMIDGYIAEEDSMIWGTRDSFNPVAGAVYEPLENFLLLRAACSLKTCFPNLEAYSKTAPADEISPSKGSKDVNIKSEESINANAGFELFFLDNTIDWRTDYFYSKYDDKIERLYDEETEDHIFVNVDSAVIHGAETTLDCKFSDILKIADIETAVSYTYIHSRNRSNAHNTDINMGDKFENTPEHKFTFDVRIFFTTGTTFIIFGNTAINQIKYTMGTLPERDAPYSTKYFYQQKLHNPVMINAKLSQRIMDNYELYVMCRNILDDYNADPFNPGPGRMWYIGGKAEF